MSASSFAAAVLPPSSGDIGFRRALRYYLREVSNIPLLSESHIVVPYILDSDCRHLHSLDYFDIDCVDDSLGQTSPDGPLGLTTCAQVEGLGISPHSSTFIDTDYIVSLEPTLVDSNDHLIDEVEERSSDLDTTRFDLDACPAPLVVEHSDFVSDILSSDVPPCSRPHPTLSIYA